MSQGLQQCCIQRFCRELAAATNCKHSCTFFLPLQYCKLIQKDGSIRFEHFYVYSMFLRRSCTFKQNNTQVSCQPRWRGGRDSLQMNLLWDAADLIGSLGVGEERARCKIFEREPSTLWRSILILIAED